ncbi:MAG: hypothetical protein LBC61_01205 [Candidatus Peribacteria bacterium]|nr:hypothetical protein [Candidatus Peribacteria bacterium]
MFNLSNSFWSTTSFFSISFALLASSFSDTKALYNSFTSLSFSSFKVFSFLKYKNSISS